MSEQILVYTTMKNEGPFVVDWVSYYLSLGVDQFLIFTNDCDDGTDCIVQRLDDLGIVTHIDNVLKPGESPQNKMLRRVRRQPAFKDADWTFCIDVDEYLNIRLPEPTLPALLEKLQDEAEGPIDVASFAWKLFGSGGIAEFSDRPVAEQFFLCDNEDSYFSGLAAGFKSITRNNGTFTRYGPHRPKGVDPEKLSSVRWVDGGGNLLDANKVTWRAQAGYSHKYARLHHYVVRSIGSFLVKRDRGRTNHINADQAETYWKNMNANLAEDRTILPVWERALPVRQKLMSDDSVKDLHTRSCAWHENKIAELHQREDWSDFRAFLYENKT